MKRIVTAIYVRAMALAAIALFVAQAAGAQNLNGPMGMAVDGSSNLYVTNFFSNEVLVYNSSLQQVGTITSGLSYPEGVAVHAGTIYVANNLSNSITTYSTKTYAQQQEVLTSGITTPIQVVVGDYGEVYVVNAAGSVSVFNTLGEPVYGGGAGTVAIALTPPYIQFWSAPTGGSIRAQADITDPITMAHYGIGFVGAAPFETFSPLLVATNPNNGDMWVTDFVDTMVVHLNIEDNVLHTFKPAASPYGIALDTVKQRLFVSEPSVNQIEVFNLKTLAREAVLK